MVSAPLGTTGSGTRTFRNLRHLATSWQDLATKLRAAGGRQQLPSALKSKPFQSDEYTPSSATVAVSYQVRDRTNTEAISSH
ncbi:hypothetical protein MY4824_008586 [Beauveria thailandica]